MPMILMLTAGALTALLTYFKGYSLKTMSIALLATLVIFYMFGCIIRMVLDSFEKKNQEETVSEEGEVIEKEAVATTESEGETDNTP